MVSFHNKLVLNSSEISNGITIETHLTAIRWLMLESRSNRKWGIEKEDFLQFEQLFLGYLGVAAIANA